MKDIKSYIIGFLTCACLFLIMGQSAGSIKISDKFGQYQGFASKGEVFLIDTKTADTWIWNSGIEMWESIVDANVHLVNHYENYRK